MKSPRNLTGTIAEAIRVEQKTSARRGEPRINDGVTTRSAISADTLFKGRGYRKGLLFLFFREFFLIQIYTNMYKN